MSTKKLHARGLGPSDPCCDATPTTVADVEGGAATPGPGDTAADRHLPGPPGGQGRPGPTHPGDTPRRLRPAGHLHPLTDDVLVACVRWPPTPGWDRPDDPLASPLVAHPGRPAAAGGAGRHGRAAAQRRRAAGQRGNPGRGPDNPAARRGPAPCVPGHARHPEETEQVARSYGHALADQRSSPAPADTMTREEWWGVVGRLRATRPSLRGGRFADDCGPLCLLRSAGASRRPSVQVVYPATAIAAPFGAARAPANEVAGCSTWTAVGLTRPTVGRAGGRKKAGQATDRLSRTVWWLVSSTVCLSMGRGRAVRTVTRCPTVSTTGVT